YFVFLYSTSCNLRVLHSFPTRRSSDLAQVRQRAYDAACGRPHAGAGEGRGERTGGDERSESGNRQRGYARHQPEHAPHRSTGARSEEHTSELQSRENLVCRLLLEKKKD